MNYVIQTPSGRQTLDSDVVEGVAPPSGRRARAHTFCELVTDLAPVGLTVEQAQSVARQDFRRALQHESLGGCDDCFWKMAGDSPCDSLCCQIAVYGLERGVDLRLRHPVAAPEPEYSDVGECIRWGLLFSFVIVALIWLHNLWDSIFRTH